MSIEPAMVQYQSPRQLPSCGLRKSLLRTDASVMCRYHPGLVSRHQLLGPRRVPLQFNALGNTSLRTSQEAQPYPQVRSSGSEPTGYPTVSCRRERATFHKAGQRQTGRMRRNPTRRSIRDPGPAGEGSDSLTGLPPPKARQPPATSGCLHTSGCREPGVIPSCPSPAHRSADDSRPAVYLSAVNSMPCVFVRPVPLVSG